MKIINKIFSKLFKEKRREEHKKQLVVLFLVFCIVIFFLIRAIFFNEERIGTRQHRKEAPFCQSDEECLLYDCTSCGNKFWVKKNVDDEDCDKNFLKVVGCKCELGQCKRVLQAE